jgi:DNA-binding CsgD family transcriptional regulator
MHNLNSLTIQEKKILYLVSLGFKSQQIAEKLFISPHTVKNHKSNICIKLNFKTTAELNFYAFSNAAVLQDLGGCRYLFYRIGIIPIFC